MQQGQVFDVSAFVNRQGLGRMQILVLLLCAMIMVVDGYDVFVMGFVLQPIAQAFGVAPAQIAPVIAGAGFGLAIGNFIVGPFADWLGRRNLLIASAVLFGLLTLAATKAETVTQLMILRFLAGLFFASVTANAITLTSEFAPERLRGTLVTWMFIGYTFGAAAGGFVAALLLQTYGWQASFWVGGATPIVMAVILIAFLPESIRFYVEKKPRDPHIPVLLRRMDPTLVLTGHEQFVLHEARSTGMPVFALFRDGRATTTALLWLVYFMNLLVITVLGAFLPTFLRIFGGLAAPQAAWMTSFYSISGIIAMLGYGRLIDMFGASRVLTVTYVFAAVVVTGLGLVDLSSPWLYPMIFCTGASVIAAQGGLNALGASIYPTRMRATGVGWSFGVGRIGGIVGPLVGGTALAGHWTALPSFLIASIPMLFAGIGTLLIGFSHAPAVEAAVPLKQGPAIVGIEKTSV